MAKVYQITQSKYGVLVYATPVDKGAMFLIAAPTLEHAEIYKYLLDFGALFTPLASPDCYEKRAIHSDGVTGIYELKWGSFKLRLLPHRELDLERAHILENLFAKKFEKVFLNMDKKTELLRDIQFRFAQQQSVSLLLSQLTC